ncbi:monooxygenase component [Candidatus Kinetoplastibacterium blastocrithidii TCC012E]|uniref:Monooxygenase component n=1 Tax=Candidatus Kinetoplastidibacterium blastocrithidiae TCC012E TaxID=1208922 RepID=M1LWS8_9PROT|nr:flavin reductase family protein [Candidatus Kinetoplastibacterium blastocrithidii]AFZ83858.1 monooxygenase component [Candidatus Kinetoplastibacterium blastocrithidii (ex Strigomonas culicis)]AGF49977.1 monooxygenase component [Candidatus Kinetoplastibacterium blastocrithidii TCC012E]
MKPEIQTQQKELRQLLGNFVTGVTIITTHGLMNRPYGLTINSFNSLSLDPPLILWSLSIKSTNKNIFLNCSNYVIHILSNEQTEIANSFAIKNPPDRFKNIKTKFSPSGTIMLDIEYKAWIDCKNYRHYIEGDHLLMIGKVQYYHYSNAEPLIFYNGDFYKKLSHI